MTHVEATPVQSHLCHDCGVARDHSFCPLPEPLAVALDGIKTTATYEKGDPIFHEGTVCHSVYVVCQGGVKLITASTEGRVLLLTFAGPGEMLAVADALRGAPHEHSALAVERSTVAAIPREKFLRFASSYGEASLRLTHMLSEQYNKAQRETRFLAFGETSAARLARLLLDWSAEKGERSNGTTVIASHVTHTELAQAIGSTRETVTRLLSHLARRGVVERTPDAIIIRDEDELARLLTY